MIDVKGFAHIIKQIDVMDSDQMPLIINTERVVVIEGRAVRGMVIDFGSELKCHESLAIFEQRKIRKFHSSEIECGLCKQKQQLVDKLQKENEDLKVKMVSFLEKMEIYKSNSDKYQLVFNLID